MTNRNFDELNALQDELFRRWQESEFNNDSSEGANLDIEIQDLKFNAPTYTDDEFERDYRDIVARIREHLNGLHS